MRAGDMDRIDRGEKTAGCEKIIGGSMAADAVAAVGSFELDYVAHGRSFAASRSRTIEQKWNKGESAPCRSGVDVSGRRNKEECAALDAPGGELRKEIHTEHVRFAERG